MEVNIYCVKDIKAGKYTSTFPSTNDETAKRDFLLAVQNPNTMYHKFPADYELYRLLSFDDDTGHVLTNDKQFVCNAIIQQEKPNE